MPIAVWPEGRPGSPELVRAVEEAIGKKSNFIQGAAPSTRDSRQQKHDLLACPVIVDNQICGAVAMVIEHRESDLDRQRVVEQVEWGIGWLEVLIRRKKLTPNDRLITILNLVATSLHYERFTAAATAVATELAGEFLCERVSIGFVKGHHIKLRALSHSASFEKKANLVRALEAAMDEAIDQQATVLMPPD